MNSLSSPQKGISHVNKVEALTISIPLTPFYLPSSTEYQHLKYTKITSSSFILKNIQNFAFLPILHKLLNQDLKGNLFCKHEMLLKRVHRTHNIRIQIQYFAFQSEMEFIQRYMFPNFLLLYFISAPQVALH